MGRPKKDKDETPDSPEALSPEEKEIRRQRAMLRFLFDNCNTEQRRDFSRVFADENRSTGVDPLAVVGRFIHAFCACLKREGIGVSGEEMVRLLERVPQYSGDISKGVLERWIFKKETPTQPAKRGNWVQWVPGFLASLLHGKPTKPDRAKDELAWIIYQFFFDKRGFFDPERLTLADPWNNYEFACKIWRLVDYSKCKGHPPALVVIAGHSQYFPLDGYGVSADVAQAMKDLSATRCPVLLVYPKENSFAKRSASNIPEHWKEVGIERPDSKGKDPGIERIRSLMNPLEQLYYIIPGRVESSEHIIPSVSEPVLLTYRVRRWDEQDNKEFGPVASLATPSETALAFDNLTIFMNEVGFPPISSLQV